MNITTLADITNAAGTHLAHGIRQLCGPVYPSIFHFHIQPLAITRAHHTIWRSFLNAITLNTNDKLITPLGAWTTTPSTHRPYRLAGGSLYTKHQNEQWYRHQLCNTIRVTRKTYRRYSGSTFFQHPLPSHNTIVDAEIRGGDFFVENIPLGTEDLPLHLQTGGPPLRAQWDMRAISEPS